MPVGRAAAETRLLTAMIRAVRAGGLVVRRSFGRRVEVREKTSPADLVSAVDLEVERRVIRMLSRAFPGTPVVSEEKENPGTPAEAFYLDPLDGTLNFLHGLAPFAVSLAFWRGGQPLAAAVHNPLSGSCSPPCAARGRGATAGCCPYPAPAACATPWWPPAGRTIARGGRGSWPRWTACTRERRSCAPSAAPAWLCAGWRKARWTPTGNGD